MHIRWIIVGIMYTHQIVAAVMIPGVRNTKIAIVVPHVAHEREVREHLMVATPLPEVLCNIIIAYINEYAVVAVFKHPAAVSTATLSKDGRWIATAGHSGLVSLWNGLTKAHERLIDAHWDPITAVSFNPESTLLATASNDKTARIWDVNSGDERAIFSGHTGYLNAVTFSPNGELLVTGSDDQKIGLWNVETGALIRMLRRHSAFVCSTAFSKTGTELVSAGNDAMVHMWDMRSHNVIRTLLGHSNDVNSVSFGADDKYVVTGSNDKTVRIWETQQQKELNTVRLKERINAVHFNVTGERILAAGDRKKAYIFDSAARDVIQILDTRARPVYSALFGSNDEHVLTASSDRVLLWSLLGSRLYNKQ